MVDPTTTDTPRQTGLRLRPSTSKRLGVLARLRDETKSDLAERVLVEFLDREEPAALAAARPRRRRAPACR